MDREEKWVITIQAAVCYEYKLLNDKHKITGGCLFVIGAAITRKQDPRRKDNTKLMPYFFFELMKNKRMPLAAGRKTMIPTKKKD